MAIGFTAELSHYPSGGRYATRSDIDAAIPPLSASSASASIAGLAFAGKNYVLAPAPPQPASPPQPLTLDQPYPPFQSPWAAYPGGTHCGQCYVDEGGRCVTNCVDCPPGQLPNGGCDYYTKDCPEGQFCCPPGQDACYTAPHARYCCPPGSSCCDARNGTCCASGESCGSDGTGFGFCCSADETHTSQGCCAESDVPCGDQCCFRVLPPGSIAYCCDGKCSDTNTDPNNCGSCDHACTAPDGGQAICVGGRCDFTCGYGRQKCGSQCCCAINPNQVLTAPGSNQNYLFYTPFGATHGCDAVNGLKVSLDVTQDMVATVTPTSGGTISNGGFSFQLNAYNPADPTTTIDWLQYVFGISDNTIYYQVQYWDLAAACSCCSTTPAACPGGGCACTGPTVNLYDTVLSLPSNTLPAGYVLEIELLNDPYEGTNIVGAIFSVTDYTGKTTSKTATLDKSQQFPIAAFEANVVGPNNSSYSQFPHGLGEIAKITYQMHDPSGLDSLCAQGGLPDAACNTPGGGAGFRTNETSNVTYDTIESCCVAQNGSVAQQTQSVST
jgi:hypothetical protein